MIRRILITRVKDDASPQAVERFVRAVEETPRHVPGVRMLHFAKVSKGPLGLFYVQDNVLEERGAIRDHPYHDEVLVPALREASAKTYVLFPQPYAQDVPEPGITSFLKRTLLLEVVPARRPGKSPSSSAASRTCQGTSRAYATGR